MPLFFSYIIKQLLSFRERPATAKHNHVVSYNYTSVSVSVEIEERKGRKGKGGSLAPHFMNSTLSASLCVRCLSYSACLPGGWAAAHREHQRPAVRIKIEAPEIIIKGDSIRAPKHVQSIVRPRRHRLEGMGRGEVSVHCLALYIYICMHPLIHSLPLIYKSYCTWNHAINQSHTDTYTHTCTHKHMRACNFNHTCPKRADGMLCSSLVVHTSSHTSVSKLQQKMSLLLR